jgi:hypothetical protein
MRSFRIVGIDRPKPRGQGRFEKQLEAALIPEADRLLHLESPQQRKCLVEAD